MSMTNHNCCLWPVRILIALIPSVITLTGCNDTASTDQTVEETEELVGNWIKRSDFGGIARSDASSFVIDGKAYIMCGYNGKKRLTDTWEYDIENDSWMQRADLPATERSSAVAFAIADKGYIGTGYDGKGYLNDFWEFDPTTNGWEQKADFAGSARYGAVAFTLNNTGYVGTGYDNTYLADFYKYTPATDSWTQSTTIDGSKRAFASSFVYDNKAYVVCGINNGNYITDFWMFDPTTATWIEKAQIADNLNASESFDDTYDIKRMNAVALVIDDKVYISTGESGSLHSDTWEYNPATDRWYEKTAFEGSDRSGAVGFSYNNRGFILTGRTSTYYYDDMYEFKPNDKYYEYD